MRLLHVIEGLNPDRGGPPQVAVALARCQRASGHRIGFASHDASSALVGDLLATRGLADADRVHVGRCFPIGSGVFKHSMSDLPNPDGLHLHGVWNAILPQASRWARARNIPYVLTTHGSLHPFSMARGGWKKRLALASTHRAMLSGANAVFTLNEEERVAAARLVGPRAQVLPNGVELDTSPVRPYAEPRPYVVFLGRLDWTKGLESLVAAHRLVVDQGLDCDLLVVGNDWGSRKSVEAAVAAARLEHRVRFLGPKYGEEKRAILAGARLLVHLPRYEGFGMAVLEALAVGTPAVIGDRCLLPGAGPSIGVIVTSSRPEEFAAAVVEVLRDPERREALSAAGRQAVAEHFRWDVFASRCVQALVRVGDSR